MNNTLFLFSLLSCSLFFVDCALNTGYRIDTNVYYCTASQFGSTRIWTCFNNNDAHFSTNVAPNAIVHTGTIIGKLDDANIFSVCVGVVMDTKVGPIVAGTDFLKLGCELDSSKLNALLSFHPGQVAPAHGHQIPSLSLLPGMHYDPASMRGLYGSYYYDFRAGRWYATPSHPAYRHLAPLHGRTPREMYYQPGEGLYGPGYPIRGRPTTSGLWVIDEEKEESDSDESDSTEDESDSLDDSELKRLRKLKRQKKLRKQEKLLKKERLRRREEILRKQQREKRRLKRRRQLEKELAKLSLRDEVSKKSRSRSKSSRRGLSRRSSSERRRSSERARSSERSRSAEKGKSTERGRSSSRRSRRYSERSSKKSRETGDVKASKEDAKIHEEGQFEIPAGDDFEDDEGSDIISKMNVSMKQEDDSWTD